MASVEPRKQGRAGGGCSRGHTELAAIGVHADLEEAPPGQLERVRQSNAHMFVLIHLGEVQPLSVIYRDIDHAPITRSIHVINHLLPSMLRKLRRPLER